jgi:hypothetical protein
MDIIDLTGLNDAEFARGFTVESLLAREPDVIWFPHGNYADMRRRLQASDALRAQYVVLDGAFEFGIAISRVTPKRAAIARALLSGAREAYPCLVTNSCGDANRALEPLVQMAALELSPAAP